MSAKISTRDLMARLQRHYIKPGAPLPGGIFLPEVGWNGGGLGAGGCDAIYVGFTSTSGRILVGHELKVSRADWLNELRQPGKADAWADQCHEWWLVVADPAIVHDGELPAGWGLMAPGTSKTRMKILHKPDRKPATHTPAWTAVRSIMARQDTLRAQAIADVRRTARDEARAEFRKQIDAAIQQRMNDAPDAQHLAKQMKAIEEALGCRIDWSNRNYPMRGHITLDELSAVAKVAQGARKIDEAVKRLTAGYQIGELRRALAELEAAIKNLRAVPGEQLEMADA